MVQRVSRHAEFISAYPKHSNAMLKQVQHDVSASVFMFLNGLIGTRMTRIRNADYHIHSLSKVPLRVWGLPSSIFRLPTSIYLVPTISFLPSLRLLDLPILFHRLILETEVWYFLASSHSVSPFLTVWYL